MHYVKNTLKDLLQLHNIALQRKARICTSAKIQIAWKEARETERKVGGQFLLLQMND